MAEIYTRLGFAADSASSAVTLADFLAAPTNAIHVVLAPDSRLEDLVPHIGQLERITIAFPKFNDGRGYSLAARLRLHHGYKGALRASGEVLIDQIQYFFRQGFDELVVINAPTLARLKSGAAPAYDGFMQADIDSKEHAPTKGHAYAWRRSA